MKREKRIEEEVNKTLRCLDEIEAIESSPFFYARLRAKIREIEEGEATFLARLFGVRGLRPALLGLVVVLNLVSAAFIWQRVHGRFEDRSQYLSALVEEYSLNVSDNYLLISDE